MTASSTASAPPTVPGDEEQRVSDRLECWFGGEDTTLGGLISTFEEKSFALLFILSCSASPRCRSRQPARPMSST